MKKVVLLFVAFATILFIASCSSEEKQENSDLSQNNFNLKSEKGYVLASDSQVLFSTVSTIIEKKYHKKDIQSDLVVNGINYIEEENFSFAILDVKAKNEEYSILVPLYVSDNYIMLRDNKGITFVKKEVSTNTSKGDVLNFETTNVTFGLNSGGVGAAVCQGGDCCKWKEIIAGSKYNCGCSSSQPAVIITTSDGCEADVNLL